MKGLKVKGWKKMFHAHGNQKKAGVAALYQTKYSLFFFFFFDLFRATPVAYGGSQARGLIGATAAGRCHSNTGSKPHLQPIPQLMATLDP